MYLSTLIISHGREQALHRVLAGLAAGSRQPDELILCTIGQAPAPLPDRTPFPVRLCRVDGDGRGLPLARARNAAARRARGEVLVFLDVDCIPGHNTLLRLSDAAAARPGLVVADVRCLPRDAAVDDYDDVTLAALGVPHPRRPRLGPAELRLCDDYGLFWSLCFAAGRRTLQTVGGFDERYVGCGYEDTDLAFRARDNYVPLYLCGAPVYHRRREADRPPPHQFDTLIANAQRFFSYWRVWPMRGRLDALRERGCIDWSPLAERIVVLRTPSADDVAAALYADGHGV